MSKTGKKKKWPCVGLLNYLENTHSPQVKSLLRQSGEKGTVVKGVPYNYAALFPSAQNAFPQELLSSRR